MRRQELVDQVLEAGHFRLDRSEAMDDLPHCPRYRKPFCKLRTISFNPALQRLGLAQNEGRQSREDNAEHGQQQRQAPIHEH